MISLFARLYQHALNERQPQPFGTCQEKGHGIYRIIMCVAESRDPASHLELRIIHGVILIRRYFSGNMVAVE